MDPIANIQTRLTKLVVVLFIYATILSHLCFLSICAHAVPLSIP